MKIWKLTNLRPKWGAMGGIIVRAETEEAARSLANTKCYGEGPVWTNSTLTSCEEVLAEGNEEILIINNID